MSTRGTFGVRIHQNDKLMYNHSDSYPSGLGVDLLTQLRKALAEPNGLHNLKLQAEKLLMVDSKVKPTEAQQKALAPYSDFGVDDGSPENWYCLTRLLQGDLIKTLKAGIGLESKTFILNSVMCEWAYIVNLDEDTFEVYTGFQEKKHKKGRYGSLKREKEHPDQSDYYGCALVKTFDLNALPTDDEFYKLEK